MFRMIFCDYKKTTDFRLSLVSSTFV